MQQEGVIVLSNLALQRLQLIPYYYLNLLLMQQIPLSLSGTVRDDPEQTYLQAF
jgi:hypothetical protein